ncbi:hypothetical protein EWF20_06655 [Sulfolobus sp. S-194]|uniref:hypothetical protein n=1 Tax=Sulfolobus sp. S-194 TaxID=2512240 RepID=UPI001436D459|nr:hypothetical protein [Sulfolobus sp. S-194]QIW23865.1 hypothetical protein EWF20_06655 [Sulfolobus sp. S-194]
MELTNQWEFVAKSIVKVNIRLRRDFMLLNYKDGLSEKNLTEVLKGEDNIITKVSFPFRRA